MAIPERHEPKEEPKPVQSQPHPVVKFFAGGRIPYELMHDIPALMKLYGLEDGGFVERKKKEPQDGKAT